MRLLMFHLMLLFVLGIQPLNPERYFSPRKQTTQVAVDQIVAPEEGQVINGNIEVRGTTAREGFLSYEVDYASLSDPNSTWYLIQEGTTPVEDAVLAVWDTSTISDGDYSLRLLVVMIDGAQNETAITNLHIRNYTLVDTLELGSSPTTGENTSSVPSVSSADVDVAHNMIVPSHSKATSLPPNPVMISTQQAVLTLAKGAGLTMVIFTILGIYMGLRALLNNRK